MTTLTPNHRERQFLQYLRSGGWVKASLLPPNQRLIDNLLGKAWLEKQSDADGTEYRMTEAGLEAKKRPVRING